MTTKFRITAALLASCLGAGTLSACAGGAEEAAAMPTPILCKTILDLTPVYVRYNEYLTELKRRGEDCGNYLGSTQNVRIRQVMPAHAPKTTLELAARAICRLRGLPEDTRYQGAKMWQSHLGEAMDILRAALPPEDFRRLVLDQPWPGPVPPDRQEPSDPAAS